MAYELPFILYNNELENGTFSITSEESGYPKENLVDWLDWTFWKSTDASDQTIIIDKGTAGIEVDTLAVLGHNFGSAGNSVGTRVRVWDDDNPSFTSPASLGNKNIYDDEPFFLELTSGSQRYNRIRIINLEEQIYAGVVVLGKRMTMPVGPEFTFDPDRQEIKSEKYLNYSGRIISAAKKYSERIMEVEFKRIAQSFITSDLLPFLEDHYSAMIPFFFVPDPGDVFGTEKIYYLTAPDNPRIDLPVYMDDINYRNWILRAQGVLQSTFR